MHIRTIFNNLNAAWSHKICFCVQDKVKNNSGKLSREMDLPQNLLKPIYYSPWNANLQNHHEAWMKLRLTFFNYFYIILSVISPLGQFNLHKIPCCHHTKPFEKVAQQLCLLLLGAYKQDSKSLRFNGDERKVDYKHSLSKSLPKPPKNSFFRDQHVQQLPRCSSKITMWGLQNGWHLIKFQSISKYRSRTHLPLYHRVGSTS